MNKGANVGKNKKSYYNVIAELNQFIDDIVCNEHINFAVTIAKIKKLIYENEWLKNRAEQYKKNKEDIALLENSINNRLEIVKNEIEETEKKNIIKLDTADLYKYKAIIENYNKPYILDKDIEIKVRNFIFNNDSNWKIRNNFKDTLYYWENYFLDGFIREFYEKVLYKDNLKNYATYLNKCIELDKSIKDTQDSDIILYSYKVFFDEDKILLNTRYIINPIAEYKLKLATINVLFDLLVITKKEIAGEVITPIEEEHTIIVDKNEIWTIDNKEINFTNRQKEIILMLFKGEPINESNQYMSTMKTRINKKTKNIGIKQELIKHSKKNKITIYLVNTKNFKFISTEFQF